ncbi:Hypothetical protein D9617_1g081500 [Elsinoe fawcettii]|nr:Hypothetical protein D9617_1g081500 [Elsinoe fawcettii]
MRLHFGSAKCGERALSIVEPVFRQDHFKENLNNSVRMSEQTSGSTAKASDKQAEQAFTDFYLRQATKEFGDDLEKLQKAPDFKNGSLEIIVEALKQGQPTINEEDRVRIGRSMLEKDGKE